MNTELTDVLEEFYDDSTGDTGSGSGFRVSAS